MLLQFRSEARPLFYRNLKRVTNGLCWLKLIFVTAPLLELLGTVRGMLVVFLHMSDMRKANADPSRGSSRELKVKERTEKRPSGVFS